MTDYLVFNDQGGASYITNGVSTGGATTYTFTVGSVGATYKFKVAAKNPLGEGATGTELTGIIAAEAPDSPTSVVTSDHDASNKKVAWTNGNANGATVTGYKVYINNNSGTPTQVSCSNDELTDGFCIVPNTTLTSTLSLSGGDTVTA